MNEPHDPLEAELASLRPHEVTPETRRRIAGRLANASPRGARRTWAIALGGGLAAACVAAVLLKRGGGEGVDAGRIPVAPRPAPTDRSAASTPSLQAYRHALARSPEALDALLDEHAARVPGPDPLLLQIHAFTPSAPEFEALTGEL